jgi:hypothetical protein
VWPLVLPIFNGVLVWAVGGREDLLPDGCHHPAAQGFEWDEVVERLKAAPVALILAEAANLPMVNHPFWGTFEGLWWWWARRGGVDGSHLLRG